MATGLQTIINAADSLAFDRRKVVGVQYTRSEIPRVSETPTRNPWRMSLTVPPVLPYNDYRDLLEQLDNLDRRYPQVITFSDNANLSWIARYRGGLTTGQRQQITVKEFTGDQLTLNVPINTQQLPDVLFASGDFLQLGTGDTNPYPFTVVGDVVKGSITGTTVQTQVITFTVHRPIFLTSANVPNGTNLNYGNDVRFKVFCPNMPTYKLIPGGSKYQNGVLINNAYIEFSGAFSLYEWVSL